MRAAVIDAFGPPDVLVAAEVPDPELAPGRVVVDVAVASITFVETQVRAGRPPHPSMAPELPAILGNGVGGHVAATGVGVDPALVGTRVVTTTGGSGGYAERVAVPADGLIPVPDGLGLSDAVALLADGRTATGLIRNADLRPGESVLVEAAGGGVGTLLVQLARDAGADVIATAGAPAKLEVATALGATAAIDYTAPDWPEQVRQASGGGIDVVLDGVGGAIGEAAFGLLDTGGRFLPYGMASGAFALIDAEEAERCGVSVVRGARPTPEESRALTEAALTEAAAGRLRAVVGQTFALERAADAHAAIEARATIGKTLLLVLDLPRDR